MYWRTSQNVAHCLKIICLNSCTSFEKQTKGSLVIIKMAISARVTRCSSLCGTAQHFYFLSNVPQLTRVTGCCQMVSNRPPGMSDWCNSQPAFVFFVFNPTELSTSKCLLCAIIWQRHKAHKCASWWGWQASSDGPWLNEPCQDWGKIQGLRRIFKICDFMGFFVEKKT